METIQAQALAEQQERPLKVRTLEPYYWKSHMDCYYFCQQCEDYFKTSGATEMNCTLFVATFLHGIVSLRWAQHKSHHKSAILIILFNFKAFPQKDLRDSQAFIDNIRSKFRRDS